jgi:hypothetical protein
VYAAVDPSGKVSLLALLLDRHSKDQFMVILLTFVPVRKRISFAPFITQNDCFTKTGSGQT